MKNVQIKKCDDSWRVTETYYIGDLPVMSTSYYNKACEAFMHYIKLRLQHVKSNSK